MFAAQCVEVMQSTSTSTQQLFPSHQLCLPDAELLWFPTWLRLAQSRSYFYALNRHVEWEQTRISIGGKSVLIPRLNAWYGDAGASYRYSGARFEPHPWIRPLQTLRARLQRLTAMTFNSALVNLYRSGSDSVGWHADDEPELGRNPIIASISFGGSRRFILKHKRDPSIPKQELLLSNGSLLIMSGSTQHCWRHCIPKTARDVAPRINITFRRVTV